MRYFFSFLGSRVTLILLIFRRQFLTIEKDCVSHYFKLYTGISLLIRSVYLHYFSLLYSR